MSKQLVQDLIDAREIQENMEERMNTMPKDDPHSGVLALCTAMAQLRTAILQVGFDLHDKLGEA